MATPGFLTIVVIDDDPIMCEMVKDSLLKKHANARVETFGTGEEAFASGLQPDLVILDYSLDSIKADAMNGIQVLSKIKERNAETPVVFLTSQDQPEVAAHTIKYGAYDYILKNETSFLKLEIAVQNILQLRDAKEPTGGQKFINTAFWILLAGVFVLGLLSLLTSK